MCDVDQESDEITFLPKTVLIHRVLTLENGEHAWKHTNARMEGVKRALDTLKKMERAWF